MNILILSCGTRDTLVKYFMENKHSGDKIICTDCSKYAPALYEADKFYLVPRITDKDYINILLNICKKEKINGVLSLIDPELSLISKNKQKFLDINVTPIVSDYDVVEMAFDKMKMFNFCKKNNINTINSYTDLSKFKNDLQKGTIQFPVFVKPYCGSCSIGIQKIDDFNTLENIFKNNENLMIQEFMSGQEIGADVYIDSLSGKVVNIFTKRKILMRAGETDKSISFKDEKLFKFIENFVIKAGFKYNIDIDIFEKSGEYYISEVNPRFGGGYLHAYECGCTFINLIKNNINKIENKPNIGNYDENIVMMKYLAVKIKKF